MSKFREIDLSQKIDLKRRVDEYTPIKFLCAEVSEEYRLPFALIRYSRDGKEQQYGLRLDLDKLVFIDHLPDEQEESILENAAPAIAKALGADLEVIHLTKSIPRS